MATGRQLTTDALQCPICLLDFENPLIIQCHHSFCRNCLVQWVARNRQFKCPTCKSQNKVPVGGVDKFPKSFIVEQMRDLLAAAINSSYPPCRTHLGEDLRLFCKTCDVAICRDCKPLDHDGHKAERIQDVAEEMRQTLRELITTVENDLEAIRKYNLGNAKDDAEVKRLKTKAIDEIRKQAIDLKRKIDKLSCDAEKEVEKQFEEIEDNIDVEFQEAAQRHQSLTQFKSELLKTLNGKEDHYVIDNYKLLLRKYDATSDNVFSSWYRMERDLAKFHDIFRKGEIKEHMMKAMLGHVADYSKPENETCSFFEEPKNDGYTGMMKKRFRSSGIAGKQPSENNLVVQFYNSSCGS